MSASSSPATRGRKVIAPDVCGLLRRDAEIVLRQAGFGIDGQPPNVRIRYQPSYEAELTVLAQVPARGQLVAAGWSAGGAGCAGTGGAGRGAASGAGWPGADGVAPSGWPAASPPPR